MKPSASAWIRCGPGRGAGSPDVVKTCAVIPARGGSRRFPGKNVAPVLGIPLIAYAIRAAAGSRHVGPDAVFVSTDDPEIAAVARRHGASVIARPAELAGDQVWTEPVIRHAVLEIEKEQGPVEVVLWMNPCLPEVTAADVDRGFALLLGGAFTEVVSVDAEGRSNSAVRVLRRETLFRGCLSAGFRVFPLDYLDVHRPDDVARVEEKLKKRNASG
jgi:CTP:molybdopterin cytidylyltransferase MocA